MVGYNDNFPFAKFCPFQIFICFPYQEPYFSKIELHHLCNHSESAFQKILVTALYSRSLAFFFRPRGLSLLFFASIKCDFRAFSNVNFFFSPTRLRLKATTRFVVIIVKMWPVLYFKIHHWLFLNRLFP